MIEPRQSEESIRERKGGLRAGHRREARARRTEATLRGGGQQPVLPGDDLFPGVRSRHARRPRGPGARMQEPRRRRPL